MTKLVGMICIVAMFCTGAPAFAQAGPEARPKPRYFDLTQLRPIQEGKTTDTTAAMQKLVGFLRDELTTPSTPGLGMGGGPISSDYIQTVIMAVMARAMPNDTILQAYRGEKDPRLKDLIELALVAQGDAGRLKDVAAKLDKNPGNAYRLIAVSCIRDLRTPAVRPILEKMRGDSLSRIVYRDVRPQDVSGVLKTYPIRMAAAEGLKRQGVDVSNWSLGVPLDAKTPSDALAEIFKDENPEQCIAVLQTLEGLETPQALEAIRTFKDASANKPALAAAHAEAARILARQKK